MSLARDLTRRYIGDEADCVGPVVRASMRAVAERAEEADMVEGTIIIELTARTQCETLLLTCRTSATARIGSPNRSAT